MFFILGIGYSVSALGLATTTCSSCGRVAGQRIDRLKRKVSVFFIPLVPLGEKYRQTCTACGAATSISREGAEQLLAGAGGLAAGRAETTTVPAPTSAPSTHSEPPAQSGSLPPWGTPS